MIEVNMKKLLLLPILLLATIQLNGMMARITQSTQPMLAALSQLRTPAQRKLALTAIMGEDSAGKNHVSRLKEQMALLDHNLELINDEGLKGMYAKDLLKKDNWAYPLHTLVGAKELLELDHLAEPFINLTICKNMFSILTSDQMSSTEKYLYEMSYDLWGNSAFKLKDEPEIIKVSRRLAHLLLDIMPVTPDLQHPIVVAIADNLAKMESPKRNIDDFVYTLIEGASSKAIIDPIMRGFCNHVSHLSFLVATNPEMLNDAYYDHTKAYRSIMMKILNEHPESAPAVTDFAINKVIPQNLRQMMPIVKVIFEKYPAGKKAIIDSRKDRCWL